MLGQVPSDGMAETGPPGDVRDRGGGGSNYGCFSDRILAARLHRPRGASVRRTRGWLPLASSKVGARFRAGSGAGAICRSGDFRQVDPSSGLPVPASGFNGSGPRASISPRPPRLPPPTAWRGRIRHRHRSKPLRRSGSRPAVLPPAGHRAGCAPPAPNEPRRLSGALSCSNRSMAIK